MDPGQLPFESGEEGLDGGVVVAAADGAEGLIQLQLAQTSGEGERRVDRAAIGMMHHPAVGSSPCEAHHQRVADELGVDRAAHGPAHDTARPQIKNGSEIEPALAGADLGDIGGPEHVRPDGVEVATHQISRGHDDLAAGGAPTATRVRAHLVVRAHQPGHPFAAAAPAGTLKLRVHSRSAVGAVRTLVDHRDRFAQPRVGLLPRRGRSGEEGVEARAGDRQNSAEPLDAIGVSMIGDESEAADRIVSWAK